MAKAYVKNVYDCAAAQPAKHINAHAWCMANPAMMDTDSFNFFSICEIRFGGAAILDNHKDADHCYFILSGKGYSLIKGKRYEYKPGEKRSATARKFQHDEMYFEAYNTALQVDCTKFIPVYHKSKLVPGVEKMPFPSVLGFLEDYAIDLGGTSGSLGMQEERTVII